MADKDRTRKLFVRSALVTSTTIATLVGAQNLIMLDAQRFQQNTAPESEPLTVVPTLAASAFTEMAALQPTEPIPTVVVPSPTHTAVPQVAPQIEIQRVAPGVVVLREASLTSMVAPTDQPPAQVVIQPPVPVELAAPDPVIVQGEAPPPIIIQQVVASSNNGGGGGGNSRSSSS